eukprot:9498671-Pyramimonas_sp.AAC.1
MQQHAGKVLDATRKRLTSEAGRPLAFEAQSSTITPRGRLRWAKRPAHAEIRARTPSARAAQGGIAAG